MLAISSNISKMVIFIFAIIIVVFLCVTTYLYLHKDESLVSKHYINYMAIPESDGVFTWLPDFFPHVAVDISISTNVEDDYFFSYFSLTIDDGGRFKKTLTVRARENKWRKSYQRMIQIQKKCGVNMVKYQGKGIA